MSTSYSVSLLVVALVGMVLGLLVAVPRRSTSRPRLPDGLLALVGWIGLAGHCGAMFDPSSVSWVPGSDAYLSAVNALGGVSIVLYVVPAVLLLAGLRRARPVIVGVVALALVATGITMYDGGSLQAHLTSIFVTVVAAAYTSARLLSAARRPRGRAVAA